MKPHAVVYTESLLLTKRRNIERSVLDNRLYTSIPTFASLTSLAPRHYVAGFTSHAPNMHEDHLGQVQERIAWVDSTSGDIQAIQDPPVVDFDAEILATALFGLYGKLFYREQIVTSVIGTQFSYAMPLHYTQETTGCLFRVVRSRVRSDWTELCRRFIDYVDKARNYVVGSQNVCDTKFWLHIAGVNTDPSLLQTPSPANGPVFRGWDVVPPVVCVVLTVPRKHLKVLLQSKDTTGIPQLESTLPLTEIVNIEEDPTGFDGSSDLVVSFWASSNVVGDPKIGVALALKTFSHSESVLMDKPISGLVVFAAELEDQKFMRVLKYCPSTSSEVELVELPPATPQSVNSPIKVIPTLGTGPAERHVTSFTGRVEIESQDERDTLLGGAEVKASQASPCAISLRVGDLEHVVVLLKTTIFNSYDLARGMQGSDRTTEPMILYYRHYALYINSA
ncbi:MYND Zn-finger protein [Ceratobasidium sp. AG-Ba]|nr:MYND Zn-finger protein [Ceratobasidium sp. AG-Ba]